MNNPCQANSEIYEDTADMANDMRRDAESPPDSAATLEVSTVWYTFAALAVTVLMGGIIAYNGDLIGRRFGKRRVTMLGLRPRHTAILITSVTGVLISAITTIVLFLLVPPVKEVILYGEQALADNIRLKHDNIQLTTARTDLVSERLNIETNLKYEQEQLAKVRQEKEKLLDEKQVVLGQLARACDERDKARGQTAAAAKTNRRLSGQNKELNEKNGELLSNNAALLNNNQDLDRKNSALTEENKIKAKYNTELATNNEELSKQSEQLTRTNDSLTQEADRIKGAIERMRQVWEDERTQLSARNSELKTENANLTKQNDELLSVVRLMAPGYQSLAEAYRALRSRRVAVHGGEDLARLVVPANSSPDAVKKVLKQLVTNAGLAAREKGAGSGTEVRAVQVVDRQFMELTSTGSVTAVVPVEVSAEQRIEAVTNRLAWQQSDNCVLALSVANSVEQEPAWIDFKPMPNRLIFTKGGVVGMRRIDTAQPSDQIFQQLVEFLKSMGRTATDRGMIPRIDAMSNEAQVGSLSVDDIVKLVDRVRAGGRTVRVTARAVRDLTASDTLDLDFKIEPSI